LDCCSTNRKVREKVLWKLREKVYSGLVSGTRRNHILTQYVFIIVHVMSPATPSRELCQEEFKLARNLRNLKSSVWCYGRLASSGSTGK